ncbi:MAG: type III-A CRISPR-associated RAMP protein Csm5 [Peptococcaceae bacterium]|nr:type III-A CRISPR-associated RAMP protein Csm5 [Peptococcaceae bacterium]MBO5302325.1 type III-A CRISPR-associated RAMP protein Csm5 [Peptococcaceae bacterium]
MKTIGHLTTYTVNLEVQSPLFIGSGETVTKKEYLHIPQENKAVLFDLQKLADYLQKKNLMKQYQNYLLDDREKNIYNFFRNNNIRPQEYAQFTDYTIDMAGESIQGDKPMRELHLFVKDAQGNPYIPGSSLKGALRTAMLAYKIYIEEKDAPEKRNERNEKYLQTLNKCENNAYKIKSEFNRANTEFEAQWLNKLTMLETKPSDMVNSVMRGISVSDSLPIAKEQLMLSQKIDGTIKGNVQYMPLFRECLRPGTVCQFTITIDEHMAAQSGWTMEEILEAVRFFKKWQEQHFYKFFAGYETPNPQKQTLWLGGGVGFANKTVNQLALGPKKALKFNAELLASLFRNGHHEKDEEIGISPHIIKVAAYKGKHYPMGQCKLEVLD